MLRSSMRHAKRLSHDSCESKKGSTDKDTEELARVATHIAYCDLCHNQDTATITLSQEATRAHLKAFLGNSKLSPLPVTRQLKIKKGLVGRETEGHTVCSAHGTPGLTAYVPM